MRFPTLVAVAVLVAVAGRARGSDVEVGTEENFESIVSQDGLVMVMFHAPWCGHCRKMSPQWEKSATQLRGIARLAKVDATSEGVLARRYEVHGFPTVLVWQDGRGPQSYELGRTAADIVPWAKKMARPAAYLIESAEQLDKLREEEKVLVVGFFHDGDHDRSNMEDFLGLASRHRFVFTYAYTQSHEVAEREGVEPPGVVVYKHSDPHREVYPYHWDIQHVWLFVLGTGYEQMLEVGPENYDALRGRGLHMAWLVVRPSDAEGTEAAKKVMRDVNRVLRMYYTMVWVNAEEHADLTSNLGIEGRSIPTVVVLDTKGAKYTMEEGAPVTVEEVEKFLTNVIGEEIDPTLRSEEAPADHTDDDGVTTVVGRTFASIVLDPAKSVLLFFHTPECEACNRVLDTLHEVGKSFSHDPSILIAKMDVSANDPPKDFHVGKVPHLALVKKKTNKIIVYDHEWITRDVVNFVHLHA